MNASAQESPLQDHKPTNAGRRFSATFLILIPLAIAAGSLRAEESIDADLLFENGELHLGDGQPGQVGDVAIAGDAIVAVGNFKTGKIKRRVDCSGLIISPGFIDLHSHSDTPATKKETRLVANYLTQGCTTLVTGNCGSGPINVAEYYDKLDRYGVGVNIAHLLPQGGLREKVIRRDRRDATPAELEQMQSLAQQAMKDGAWGMSTGLIYVPSSYADTAELSEIAKVVGRHGGIYVSHIRGEGSSLLDSVGEALQIGRNANLPIHISHFKSSGKNSWGLVRVAIDVIEKERAAGVKVTADQYPYIASSTSLSATFLPAWAREGGSTKMLERLNSEQDADRIQQSIRRKLASTDQGQRIQIARYRPNPSWAGRRLKEIADELSIDPYDLILQILNSDRGTKVVNYGIDESDVRYVMQRPWVATASDGSARIPSEEVPHPRNYGTFPRKIGYYSVRENVIPLRQAIRSATGLPADILGMPNRGYLRSGYAADLAIWQRDELIDRATFAIPDRYSAGIRYLLVNGTPAIWDSNVTGALAGKTLRHRSSVAPP
ncbi:MAG: amidohydrolase family protein [Rubripirellula sp.]|nr:amidohydrolase family protein [Rubripirellula sp.]